MATLRALVGAGSALAFMGLVVFVPLGWTVVIYTAESPRPNSSRPLLVVRSPHSARHLSRPSAEPAPS